MSAEDVGLAVAKAIVHLSAVGYHGNGFTIACEKKSVKTAFYDKIK